MARDKNGKTPLHYCCENQKYPFDEVLLDYLSGFIGRSNLHAADLNGCTPLHLVGSFSFCAESLIAYGAMVDARNGEGMTPLHMACRGGYEETARVLMRHGAAINACDQTGRTPLHWACLLGKISTARVLMEERRYQCSALLQQKDTLGRTPLTLAIMSQSKDGVVKSSSLVQF